MSTRYVWEKYNTKDSYTAVKDRENTSFNISSAVVYAGYSYNVTSDGKFEVSPSSTGPNPIKVGNGMTQITKTYPYIEYADKYLFHAKNPTYSDYWVLNTTGGSESKPYRLRTSDERTSEGDSPPSGTIIELFEIEKGDPIQGTVIGEVSANSSSAYPNNGIYSNYWYTFLGSDTIDPLSVSYSNSKPNPGSSVTVSVSPRSPTYGGTINYQFSYSTNGGSSWTNIGGATTSTSKSVTIPTSATQFKARVIASDRKSVV